MHAVALFKVAWRADLRKATETTCDKRNRPLVEEQLQVYEKRKSKTPPVSRKKQIKSSNYFYHYNSVVLYFYICISLFYNIHPRGTATV